MKLPLVKDKMEETVSEMVAVTLEEMRCGYILGLLEQHQS